MGVILVRVEGDLAEGPQLFKETDGDKCVKSMVEERLGVDLGMFMIMVQSNMNNDFVPDNYTELHQTMV